MCVTYERRIFHVVPFFSNNSSESQAEDMSLDSALGEYSDGSSCSSFSRSTSEGLSLVFRGARILSALLPMAVRETVKSVHTHADSYETRDQE